MSDDDEMGEGEDEARALHEAGASASSRTFLRPVVAVVVALGVVTSLAASTVPVDEGQYPRAAGLPAIARLHLALRRQRHGDSAAQRHDMSDVNRCCQEARGRLYGSLSQARPSEA